MPINNVTGYLGTQATRNSDGSSVKVSRGDVASGSTTGSAAASDKVSLTEASVRLRSLESALADMPVIDQKKVDELKLAIANGSYSPDSGKIAEKMVQFELEMFGTKGK